MMNYLPRDFETTIKVLQLEWENFGLLRLVYFKLTKAENLFILFSFP